MRFKSRTFTENTSLSLIHASIEIFLIGYSEHIRKNGSASLTFEKEEIEKFQESQEKWPCRIFENEDKNKEFQPLSTTHLFQEFGKSLVNRKRRDGLKWEISIENNARDGSVTLNIKAVNQKVVAESI